MSVAEQQPVRVARFWTRARRFPQLIGKALNGERLWGGPYTITQAIVGFAVGFVLWKTRDVWGPDSFATQAGLWVLVTGGTVWALGKIPLGSRNPIITVLGLGKAVASPRSGRVSGRRTTRRRTAFRALTIPPRPAPVWPGPCETNTGPTPTRAEHATGTAQSETTPPTAQRTEPAAPARPLTGLQQLLAEAAHNHDDGQDWESAGRRVKSNLTGVSQS